MTKQIYIEQLIRDMYPSGIDTKMLKDIVISIRTGLNPRDNFVLNVDGADLYYVTVKEIVTGKVMFSDKTDRITEAARLRIQERSRLEVDDILFSGIGTIGKVAIADIPVDNWNCSESVFIIKPNKRIVLPKFLMYYLRSSRCKEQYEASSVGSTMKGVRKGILESIKIPIPSLQIQEKIVYVLDTIGRLVDNIQDEIEARQMQYNEACITLMNAKKNNWSIDTFFNLGKIYGGLSGKKKADFTEGNAKYVTYKNVYSNPAIDMDIIDTVKVGKDERQNTIQYGDVIFTGSSETPDECAISSVVNQHVTEKIYLNSFCFGFRFNDLSKIYIDFYKHYFRGAEMRAYAKKAANGTTRFNVSKALFELIPIPVPPIAEQRAIAEKLDTIEAFINNLKTERDLRQLQYEYYREYLINLLK